MCFAKRAERPFLGNLLDRGAHAEGNNLRGFITANLTSKPKNGRVSKYRYTENPYATISDHVLARWRLTSDLIWAQL
jgi:hypothetical protein